MILIISACTFQGIVLPKTCLSTSLPFRWSMSQIAYLGNHTVIFSMLDCTVIINEQVSHSTGVYHN